MLVGTKYEDILVGSCIIVHLREDYYKTYQISRNTINKVFELDLSKFVK